MHFNAVIAFAEFLRLFVFFFSFILSDISNFSYFYDAQLVVDKELGDAFYIHIRKRIYTFRLRL